MMMKRRSMDRRLLIFLILAGATVILTVAVKYLLPVVVPFVLGFLISAMIEPVIVFAQKKLRIARKISVPIVLFLVLLLLAALLTVGVARIYVELRQLLAEMPLFLEKADALLDQLRKVYIQLPAQVVSLLDQTISSIADVARKLILMVLDTAAGLPNTVLTITVAVIASFFISRDKERILTFLKDASPEEWRADTVSMKDEIFASMLKYLRAQMLLVLFTTVLTTLLFFVIGVKHALILGLVMGLLDFLPMIGVSAVFVPWIGYKLLTGSFGFALLLAGVFAVQQFSRQALESWLVGENLGVHPLAVMLSVWAGIKLFGIGGFFYGPLILIILKALARGLQHIIPARSNVSSNETGDQTGDHIGDQMGD
jgi:sporulation integral membrane protein YtvI